MSAADGPRPGGVAPGDGPVVVLAALTWLATLLVPAVAVPRLVLLGAAAAVLAAWRVRRWWLLIPAVASLGGLLAAAALAGLAPAAAGRLSAEVVVAGDPVSAPGRVEVVVDAPAGRLEATATGPARGVLRSAHRGERLRIDGVVTGRAPGDDRALTRRVVGRVEVGGAQRLAPAPAADRLADGYRSLLARGADVLDDRQRGLFLGLVLGDTRDQDALTADAFRAAGLVHLTAVSGQNVAFLLAVVTPALRWLPRRTRLGATLAVLAAFGLVWRFEPSVVRALAMTGVVALAADRGRSLSALRALGLAVTGLVLVDPLLGRALGFQLSVAATAGLVVVGPRLAAVLPGPRRLAAAVGVVVAAQLAVAPLLLPLGGEVPLVAVPANLVATPVAGPVMMWGATAGAIAGWGGPVVATVVHWPTGVALRWILGVADLAARAPVGGLSAAELGLAVGVAIVGFGAARLGRRGPALVAATVLATVLVVAGRPPHPEASTEVAAGPGAEVWVGATGRAVVVVDGRVRVDRLLGTLRARGIGAPAVAVLRSVAATRSLRPVLDSRWAATTVVVPPEAAGSPDRRVVPASGPLSAVVDGITLDVAPDPGGGPLVATVALPAPPTPPPGGG